MEHRGVSAAEKYAELEKAGALRPRCSCHGEEMYWQKISRVPAGGHWRCCVKRSEFAKSAKRRQWAKRYYEKNRERVNEINRRSRERNLESCLERERRYRKTQARREAVERYAKSKKGQETRKRVHARRVCMFGQRFMAPDMDFREHAVQLREERRRALKEATNG